MEGLKHIQEIIEGNQVQEPGLRLQSLQQNNPSNGHINHNDGFLIRKHLELRNGKVKRMSADTEQKNQIEYFRYHGIKGIILFTIDTILNYENFFAIVYIILNSVAELHVELTMYYPVIALIFNIVISGILNFFTDLKLRRACREINNKECNKYVNQKKQKKDFEKRTWSTLQPGDIIRVTENEEFPADVLILDVISKSNNHQCFVRGGSINECDNNIIKRSCEGTQNKTPGITIPPMQFVDQISGLLKYEYNYNGFFSGTYKLYNNPAAFQLTMENVALRGSYLVQTQAVVCLVLNVGTLCMGSIFKGIDRDKDQLLSWKTFKNQKNFDKIYKPVRILECFIIILAVGFSIFVTFWVKYSTSSSRHKFLEKIVSNYKNSMIETESQILSKDVIGFCSGLLVCLPLSYKIILDIIVLIQADFVEYDYNVAPSDLKFNRGSSMKALGKISNLFISKSALMNHNIKKVKMVKITDRVYQDLEKEDKNIQQPSFDANINNRSQSFNNPSAQKKKGNNQSAFQSYSYPFNVNQSNNKRPQDEVSNASFNDNQGTPTNNLNRDDADQNDTDDEFLLPNQIHYQPAFVNYSLNSDLNSISREKYKEFFRALIMCHQANRRKEPSQYSKCLYRSLQANEQAQLMFAHTYGFEFIRRKNKVITINCQGVNERYDIVILETFPLRGQDVTVIMIKPYMTSSQGSTVYLSGPISSLYEYLGSSEEEQQNFLRDMKEFSQCGVLPIIFAKKNLDHEQTLEFENKIRSFSSFKNPEFNENTHSISGLKDIIHQCLQPFMFELQTLGTIGLQEVFNIRDSLAVQDLINNGIKVWMLSREDEAIQIINSNAMKLLTEESNPMVINGQNEKEVEDQIKNCIKTITGGKESFCKNEVKPLLNKNETKKSQSNQNLNDITFQQSSNKQQITFSDLIIGSSIKPNQKTDLIKHLKQFTADDTFIMSIIGSSEDQNLILDSDVSTLVSNVQMILIGMSYKDCTNQIEIPHLILTCTIILNFFGMIFMLEDENLIGVQQYFYSPSALLYTLFVLLFCSLRNYLIDTLTKTDVIRNNESYKFYESIEDLLFLEEFEDPDQEFNLAQYQSEYTRIQKIKQQRQMQMVNRNLMKIQRSDSMDLIIEKLNQILSNQQLNKVQDSTILNWLSLNFVDQSKENEYIETRQRVLIDKQRKVLLIIVAFNLLQMFKESILSSLDYISFYSFYFYLGYLLAALILYVVTLKFQQYLRAINFLFLVVLLIYYCIFYYYIDMIEFSLYFNILMMVFTFYGAYFRSAIFMAFSSYILMSILANSYFQSQGERYLASANFETSSNLSIICLVILWFFFIASWSLQIYWDEKYAKLDYWFYYKKVKESQNLQFILQILMPAFVRERIRQGQRYIADDQVDVTICFCDISEFDDIVSKLTARELCEWLDHIYNAFDQLCERNGLQKIETVGKTYMACGGLKETEKKFDQASINQHHSERVTQFAFNIQRFMLTQKLKDGTPVRVKIGIHSGKVISGVVGDIKPQFSLVGDTVNKTSRVCGQCRQGRILLSKETRKLIDNVSNQYYYDQISIFLKGIGQEDAFYVHKKNRGNNFPNLLLDRNQKKKDRSRSIQANLKSGQVSRNKVAPAQNARVEGTVQEGNPETSRSLIQSDGGSQSYNPFALLNRSGVSDDLAEEDSVFRDNFFQNEANESKIQNDEEKNQVYNLVQRPSYLFNFKENSALQIQLEEQFRFQMISTNIARKFIFFVTFAIINKVETVFTYLHNQHNDWRLKFVFIQPAVMLLFEIYLLVIRWKFIKLENLKLVNRSMTIYFILHLLSVNIVLYKIDHDSRLIQIYLIEIMITCSYIFFLGCLQLRYAVLIYCLNLCFWIFVNCSSWMFLTVKSYSYFFEIFAFTSQHIFILYFQEMQRRKTYNNDKMIEQDLIKTNNLLSNLVPPPVLEGIKHDQKVVDELEDVTLLFTDMVKFTDFCRNVQDPKEVVQLLSQLFTRFDLLCVQNQVYKVHTIGDCYVIMGYTGHIPQSERTPQIKAQEAYRVIKTGFDMIDVIQEVRETTLNKDLKELDMRIGIHTGKIVAGIIGTKIVRYDIFGADVLIANKMESNGLPGEVVISESTKEILSSMPVFLDSLVLKHHKTVNFEQINRKNVESYVVSPLIENHQNDQDQSSSGSDLEDDDDEIEEEPNDRSDLIQNSVAMSEEQEFNSKQQRVLLQNQQNLEEIKEEQ
ncbi:adenylate and guanylate cyclase catalytic domain containing protein [Stylonychia lemnae]|uniref:Adenylate and guanylate cyclase catalytic domain containing protein n=1 Tax=Stylonychia lemnae TaxID=5949 RepID=A0A078A8Y7_STYLE|nr:adenylate and guanylate cyclase catalytic domain containing protein [Stylonychia lemnae]|eukprot:CDW78012.1 adenylate and guanylate cyclase catalytic domain containing protein [Stylonychia lemnae]